MKKMATSVTMSTKGPQPYIAHLSKTKKFKTLIEQQGEMRLRKRKNIPLRLCASIMSQQLSVKVAEVIYRRFLELFGKEEPTPRQILDLPNETLRGIGLSNAKVNYVKNVAQFAIEHGMDYKKLDKMSNEEIIEYLVPIKGVGRWTVEMLLLFTMGREDVFAPDDLGIQKFMIDNYNLDSSNKKKFREDMLRISQKWSPYRSFACLHMWNWKDRDA
jgi:DNA-3-methyladenine glycosylase II